MALSRQHAVESTVIGRYTDSGKLHITYNGATCAYVDLDLLTSGFPQWEFEAVWQPPALRGLTSRFIGAGRFCGLICWICWPAQYLFQGVGLPPVRPRGAGHQRDQTPGRCRSGMSPPMPP
jgi:hypothetical protein